MKILTFVASLSLKSIVTIILLLVIIVCAILWRKDIKKAASDNSDAYDPELTQEVEEYRKKMSNREKDE